jgi:hypothetical protein
MVTTSTVGSTPCTGLAKASEIAAYLLTTPNQLSRLRFEGHGPNYVKLGRSVRYRWEDVHSWVEANVQATVVGTKSLSGPTTVRPAARCSPTSPISTSGSQSRMLEPARRRTREEATVAALERALKNAPPLTDEMRARIVDLLAKSEMSRVELSNLVS